MKHPKYILLACILSLNACAAVYTDASDANHVTFLNSDGESITSLTKKQILIVPNMARRHLLEKVIHSCLRCLTAIGYQQALANLPS